MAGFRDRLKSIFTGEGDYEYDDEYDENHDEEDDYYNNQAPVRRTQNIEPSGGRYVENRPHSINHNNNHNNNNGNNNGVVSISTSVSVGLCMFNPSTIEDTVDIMAQIKARNIIVINLEVVDSAISQRISDVICGATYVLDSHIKLISDKIMIIVPNNVDMSGELKDKIQASGIQIPNTGWN